MPTTWPLRSEQALGSVFPSPYPPPRLELTLSPEARRRKRTHRCTIDSREPEFPVRIMWMVRKDVSDPVLTALHVPDRPECANGTPVWRRSRLFAAVIIFEHMCIGLAVRESPSTDCPVLCLDPTNLT